MDAAGKAWFKPLCVLLGEPYFAVKLMERDGKQTLSTLGMSNIILAGLYSLRLALTFHGRAHRYQSRLMARDLLQSAQ